MLNTSTIAISIPITVKTLEHQLKIKLPRTGFAKSF